MKEAMNQVYSTIDSSIQQILSALPFYVFLVDSNHRILAANDAVKRDLGVEPGQLVGSYCPAVIHGCDEPVANCPLSEAVETGQATEQEMFDSRSGRWLSAAIYPTSIVADDGRPVCLHFARDVTEFKKTAGELSRSLEHHRAISSLLQKLQYCRDSTQILEVLIDEILSLSWLGMSATAIGFLADEHGLRLKAHRNVDSAHLKRCGNLRLGECCCGKAAELQKTFVCSSASSDHSIRFEEMSEHQHVILPISHEGHLLGLYTLYLRPDDEIDDFRLGFLEAAAAATGAALSGQLAREEAKRTQERYIAQLISSQEDERKIVARDLHDHLCQSLSAILLEMQVHADEDHTLKLIRDGFQVRVRDLIDEARQIAGKLRPSTLDDYGLESALSRLIRELSTHTEITIDFQFVASPDCAGKRLPTPIEIGLYRIAVEALDNVLAHTVASRVSVIVVWQQNKVMMLVEDDGCGFEYEKVRRNISTCPGLIGMEERVAVLGGSLKIESELHRGTIVRAEIDLEKETN